MAQPAPNTRFWAILAVVNLAILAYPVQLYMQADSGDAQLLAVVIVLGVGFVLAVMDTVSAIMRYMA